jgi:hypothetical protein
MIAAAPHHAMCSHYVYASDYACLNGMDRDKNAVLSRPISCSFLECYITR